MGEHPEDLQQVLPHLVMNDVYYEDVQAILGNPNQIFSGDRTLLHVAAQSSRENSRILQLLLDRGADANFATPSGHTPLHFAVCSRKRNAVAALINAGAFVNSRDSLGRTALHFAISKRWPNNPGTLFNQACDMWIVERLLSHPEIMLDPVDEAGETPLMWAVKERNSEAASELLRKGADPNIPNEENRTPLHEALSARDPFYDVVAPLLANNAGIYCEDNLGQTPIDYLVRIAYDDEMLTFALRCVTTIAFKYRIRESLQHKLKRIPVLSRHFDECCKEIRLMNNVILRDKITLHDFALNGCCPLETFVLSVMDIYKPVVELLLSGLFRIYFRSILYYIPFPELCGVLLLTVGSWLSLNPLPPGTTKIAMFDAIGLLYEEDLELKRHLRRVKELLVRTL